MGKIIAYGQEVSFGNFVRARVMFGKEGGAGRGGAWVGCVGGGGRAGKFQVPRQDASPDP